MGKRRRIEAALADWTGHDRELLFEQLLERELELHHRANELSTAAKYCVRFPEFTPQIAAIAR